MGKLETLDQTWVRTSRQTVGLFLFLVFGADTHLFTWPSLLHTERKGRTRFIRTLAFLGPKFTSSLVLAGTLVFLRPELCSKVLNPEIMLVTGLY